MLSQLQSTRLSLNSTLEDLFLYDFQVEPMALGAEVAERFKQNPSLPGVLLTEDRKFIGMISRQNFWERMGRLYSLEVFSKRPIEKLYKFLEFEHLILNQNSTIVAAAQQSLERMPELIYEPIVVELKTGEYRLLDVHQLLLAQSKIHELATHLLEEQTQAKLIQTEKMAALGQMIASVAHEILNPVNFICGNIKHLSHYGQELLSVIAAYEEDVSESTKADVLREEIDFEFIAEDFPKLIDSVSMGADRLKKIVGALRNFSHMNEAQRKPVDLHACLDDTLLILQGRLKNFIDVVKHYGSIPLISGYSGQISQVFMNLVSNAIDALTEMTDSKPGADWQPRIEITTTICSDDPNWIAVQIADNGPGIPPEIQARVFDTFFTTKPVGVGTGLGLAISHQIVTEKHGGHLNLWSEPGIGTRFELLLPIKC